MIEIKLIVHDKDYKNRYCLFLNNAGELLIEADHTIKSIDHQQLFELLDKIWEKWEKNEY